MMHPNNIQLVKSEKDDNRFIQIYRVIPMDEGRTANRTFIGTVFPDKSFKSSNQSGYYLNTDELGMIKFICENFWLFYDNIKGW